MNTELFIANRILSGKNVASRMSKPIVRIAILGISLGLIVMILTVAIVTGFQNEIRDKVIGFGSNIQITSYDSNASLEPTPISRKQPFYPSLKDKPGIRHIQVYATKNGLIKTKKDNEGVLLKGVGSDYDWSFIEKNLKEGKVFTVTDTGSSKSIVISKFLASRLELKTGDKMLIYFVTKKRSSDDTEGAAEYEQRVRDFYVSGIYETGFEEYDKKVVLVDIAQVQRLNYWDKNQVGGFEVSIDDYNDLDELGAMVFEEIGQELNAQTIRQTNSTVFTWLDLQDVNAIVVISLMILVAGINMISALLILILERTNMIGILKALGSSNGSIQKIFLYNAAYLIGKGMLWGNLIGIAICLVQKQFGIFTLPQETYYISVVPIHLAAGPILLLNAGTLLACLLMLVVPSFIVSKITPVKAIRFS